MITTLAQSFSTAAQDRQHQGREVHGSAHKWLKMECLPARHDLSKDCGTFTSEAENPGIWGPPLDELIILTSLNQGVKSGMEAEGQLKL